MQQFKHAATILEVLQQHGFEAYFVGGSVRDFIIGKQISDVDIATSALPQEVMRIFPQHAPVGLEHGTVLVLLDNIPYEVTTFRIEADYEDFRRPSHVSFVRSLHEDLQRRDFTMNAIAMTAGGELVDPFKGQNAIQNQIIETVGNPNQRFQEDALRMMRGIRFVSTLGFRLSEATRKAIIDNIQLLSHIAVERICAEFEKLLRGKHVQAGLLLLIETDLYAYLPCFENKRNQLTCAISYSWGTVQSVEEAWSLLLQAMEPIDVESLLKKWKLSNKKINVIMTILRCLHERQQTLWNEQLLYRYGEEIVIMTERVFASISGQQANISHIRSLYEQLPIRSRRDLAATGTDLLEWTNKKGGPWVAVALEQIEQEIVCGRLVNTKGSIKEWLEQCNLL